MTESLQSNLEGFLRKHLTTAPADDRVTRFEVRVGKTTGGVGRKLDDWVPSEERDPKVIARDIIYAVQSDCNTQHLRQSYVVLVYRESDEQTSVASKAIAIRPVGEEEGGVEGTEPATKEGLLGQLMRHIEADRRVQIQGLDTTFKHQAKVIEQLSAMNERLMGQFGAMIERTEEAMLARVNVEAEGLERFAAAAKTPTEQIKELLLENMKMIMPHAGPVIMKNLMKMLEEEPSPKKLAAKLSDAERETLLTALIETQPKLLQSGVLSDSRVRVPKLAMPDAPMLGLPWGRPDRVIAKVEEAEDSWLLTLGPGISPVGGVSSEVLPGLSPRPEPSPDLILTPEESADVQPSGARRGGKSPKTKPKKEMRRDRKNPRKRSAQQGEAERRGERLAPPAGRSPYERTPGHDGAAGDGGAAGPHQELSPDGGGAVRAEAVAPRRRARRRRDGDGR